jgi:hypothetical protein
MMDLENEWMQYLSCQNSGFRLSKPEDVGATPAKPAPTKKAKATPVVDILHDDQEDDTVEGDDTDSDMETNEDSISVSTTSKPPPEMGVANENMELIISTKTKVLFLNQAIDIHRIYWEIPILPYWIPKEGVLKKQIKVVSKTPEEFEEYKAKLSKIIGTTMYQENIIKQIHNPGARTIKFKDERKLTVGISKKDITSYRGKVKNAFYNCFALVVRYHDLTDNLFREIHVKVFNTGKMEIPGILNSKLLDIVKVMILDTIQPNVDTKLDFIENSNEDHVLVNSNFNCGFFVNREKFHAILSSDKYGIESSYDPCSYPGVKCKFYFNNELGFDTEKQNGCVCTVDHGMKLSELLENKKYTEVSFMIFRTGSGLIVGNCTERILRFVFDFIKRILIHEYKNIAILSENPVIKNKKPKLRRRMVSYTEDYYHGTIKGSL